MNFSFFLLVECVQSPAAFFAKRLHDSIAGMGTDDTSLIRLIVSRSEIDLGTIKDEYERMYNKTLLSAVNVSHKTKVQFILFRNALII